MKFALLCIAGGLLYTALAYLIAGRRVPNYGLDGGLPAPFAAGLAMAGIGVVALVVTIVGKVAHTSPVLAAVIAIAAVVAAGAATVALWRRRHRPGPPRHGRAAA